jgi:hypothetical protein
MDRTKFHQNRLISSKIIIPTNKKDYVLFLKPPIENPYLIPSDENRRFLRVKTILLDKLASCAQQLIDRLDGKPPYSRAKDYLVKHVCTLMEFLAN